MPEIKCPKCGAVFTPTDSEYAKIVKEIRDQEFEKEIEKEVELALIKQEQSSAASTSKLNEEIALLKSQITTLKNEKENAIKLALSEKESTITKLEAELANQKTQEKLNLNIALSDKDKKIADLQNELDKQDKIKKIEIQEQKDKYESQLKEKQELVDYYKDLRVKLSTKMLGETLEQHCENAFNAVAASAFPRAQFGKDNKVVEHGKGDYVFKDFTEDNVEIISIEFEMKNEAEETEKKQKNSKFFEKLDADRKKKGCEYAVLVTTLEAENELYNNGIYEVPPSMYEKMYVIRPQSFITIISLLRNMALRNIEDKRQLVLARNSQADLTNFQDEFEKFKASIRKNAETATNKFDAAIEEIDKTIDHLVKVRENLLSSNRQYDLAVRKIEDMTTVKLLKHSPSLKAEYQKLQKEKKED